MKSKKKVDSDIFEYKEYEDQLNDEEKEYIEKFYREFYFSDFYRKGTETINKGKDVRKELLRVHNSKTRDAMGTYNQGDLLYDTREAATVAQEEEWEWQKAYKMGGEEMAVRSILDQTRQELNNMNLDIDTVLVRFFVKMDRLRKYKKDVR